MIKNTIKKRGKVTEIFVDATNRYDSIVVTMDTDILDALNDLYADGWRIIQHHTTYRKISAVNTKYLGTKEYIFPLRPVFRNTLHTVRYLDDNHANLQLSNLLPIYTDQQVTHKDGYVIIPVTTRYTGNVNITLDKDQFELLSKYGCISIRNTKHYRYPWVSVGSGEDLRKAYPVLFKKRYDKPLKFINGDRYDLRKQNIISALTLLPAEPECENQYPNPLTDDEVCIIKDKLYLYKHHRNINNKPSIFYSFYYINKRGKLEFVFNTFSIDKANVATSLFKSHLEQGNEYITSDMINEAYQEVRVTRLRRTKGEYVADKIENGVATITVSKEYKDSGYKEYTIYLDEEDYNRYLESGVNFIKVCETSTLEGVFPHPVICRTDDKISLRKFLFGTHTHLKDGNRFNLRRDNIIFPKNRGVVDV